MRTLPVLILTALAAAQTPDPASTPGFDSLPLASQQLARIRAHMAELLEHQPNYTCLETVQRMYRVQGSRRAQLDDTLRLEVALVDGEEMFAWPGSKKFEITDLRQLVPNGTFGNGTFALHARTVFMSRVPVFEYRGAEIIAGASGPLERYDFQVRREVSGYTIRSGDRTGVAGFHGSFWADKQSLDVRRLEVIAQDIPADLGVAAASDSVDYARVRIGATDFLLPVKSDLVMAGVTGIESQNHVTFSGCRQYTGESTLKFDDVDAPAATAPSAPGEARVTPDPMPRDLPAGLQLELVLDRQIDLDKAAIGDPVPAHLNADLRNKTEVLARKGAMVEGRITRLDHRDTYTILGITLISLEAPAVIYRLAAKLEDVTGLQFAAPPRNVRPTTTPPRPGEGLLVLRSGRVLLNRGMLMYWRS